MSSRYPEPNLANHNKVLFKSKRYWIFSVQKDDEWVLYDKPTDVVVYDKRTDGFGVIASAVVDDQGRYTGCLSVITQQARLISGNSPKELLSSTLHQMYLLLRGY